LVLGLPIAVLLVITGPGGLYRAPLLNRVSAGSSMRSARPPLHHPLVALIPLTRLIVALDRHVAAIVPLSIAAIPFYARVAESRPARGRSRPDRGNPGDGRAPHNIVFKVLIPEALPASSAASPSPSWP